MSEDRMTAEKFLEVSRNSKTISIGEDRDDGSLYAIIRYHTTEDEESVKTYQGPDPTTTPYAVYMKFLAEIYSIPGLSSFVENYQRKLLRRMGRMTQ